MLPSKAAAFIDLALEKIDSVARFFLCVLVFWLPYSLAVIESCVCTCLFLCAVKLVFRFLSIKYPLTFPQFINKLKQRLFTRENLPVLVFLIISILSALLSPERVKTIYNFFSKTFEWFIIYYLFIYFIKTRKHVYIILSVMFVTSIAVCLDSMGQYYLWHKDIFFGHVLVDGRATASFMHPNSLGAYLIVYIVLLNAFLYCRPQRRFFMLLCFIAAVWALYVSFSRGAWIATAIGVVISTMYLKPKIFKYGIIVFIIAIALGTYVSRNALVKKHENRVNALDSLLWRFHVWEDTIKMVKVKPLLGHGQDSYSTNFQKFRRKERGIYDYLPTYAHNSYLQMMAELGILGCGAFLWLMAEIIHRIHKKIILYEFKCKLDYFVLVGLFSGVLAFLFHSFFDTNFYSLQLSSYLWYILGLLVAFIQIKPENT